MDSLQTAVNLVSEGCYFASIVWKDAYYSVPVAKADRKYLCFQWQGSLYRYTCLPNGLALAPRKFTEIAKVLFAELRKQGHMNTHYIDDSLHVAVTESQCKANVMATVTISEQAGFVVHPVKSVLHPTQRITYLGFVLDSINMTVSLTPEKASKIKNACSTIVTKQLVTIQELAEVVGMIVASFPGVQYGPLFYRLCDNHKNAALKAEWGNYAAKTTLPQPCIDDLQWWIENITTSLKRIHIPQASISLERAAPKEVGGL